ncbi:MAG: HAMP domain-containing histidine kinase [Planctomycetes bacterium]|nr:HAMP domain-containing histidine kinase [Planctomycetota bacterium]
MSQPTNKPSPDAAPQNQPIGTPGNPGNPGNPDDLMRVEQLLEHFEKLEVQFQQVRDGLTHSHRLATLGTIASIIAHEYNNILTPIISYAQLALAKPDDRDFMKKALEKSLQGAERAANISSSLLGFAREADQKHAAKLRTVVDESVACLAREPKKDGIQLTLDIPDIQVAMTPLSLQQVLVNLILNARQAMNKGGGRLAITARVDKGLVQIDVADTGPGIPDQIRDRLFEPFVTHRPSTGEAGEKRGTGLGLCICRDLVRQAGGNITCDSEPGKGTTFHITVPKADDLFA